LQVCGPCASSVPLALKIAARPAISKLHQSHSRWREGHRLAKVSVVTAQRKQQHIPLGTTFRFKLNTKAKVKLVFTKNKKGRKSKRSAKATLSFAGHKGTNRVAFQGRISRRKTLRPGRYKLTAAARSGRARSKPRSLRFTIVP
jgi:hypothetical protein